MYSRTPIGESTERRKEEGVDSGNQSVKVPWDRPCLKERRSIRRGGRELTMTSGRRPRSLKTIYYYGYKFNRYNGYKAPYL